MLKRFRCRLFGCGYDEHGPFCPRCGEYIYDPDHIEYRLSWLAPLRDWLADVRWHLGRRFFVQRCASCRKRLWPWSPRVHGDHCTEKCFDTWIPF